MEVLSTVLTVVYVFACLFLGFVVLIQKGEGGGLGGAFGGGAVDVAFGAKADMTWKRATAAAATLFMCLAVVIGIIDERNYERSKAETDKTAQTTDDPDAPEAPADGAATPADGDATPPADGGATPPADGGTGQ